MAVAWRYTERASKDLLALERRAARLVVKKITSYCTAPDPFTFAKPLQGSWKGLFRFRIGDYRAIFRKEPSGQLTLLLILRIKHRKEVYE
jgi:mRNA interferase RelE/StbE